MHFRHFFVQIQPVIQSKKHPEPTNKLPTPRNGGGDKGDNMACDCQIDGYDDYDTNECYFENIRTAAKEHQCCECGEFIKKGEKYELVNIKKWGRWYTEKTCIPCCEIRKCFFCSWMFGEMFEDLNNNEIRLQEIENLSMAARQKFFENVIV